MDLYFQDINRKDASFFLFKDNCNCDYKYDYMINVINKQQQIVTDVHDLM